MTQTANHLHAGVAAARNNDKPCAREQLRLHLEHDPQSEIAWLWLATVAETTEERLRCVERVIEINPANERALAWLTPARAACAQESLTRGVAAAKSGDAETARTALRRAVELDPQKELAWLWLASVSVAPAEKLAHLERVLAINPANGHALTGVKHARAQLAQHLAKQSFAETRIDADATMPDTPVPVSSELNSPHVAQVAEDESEAPRTTSLDAASSDDSTAVSRDVAPTPGAPSAARTIMIVDDSPTIRKLVTIKLEKQGHRVIPAEDGMEALSRLNEVVPDVILLDITMPRLDGYQLCKLIRANDATKHIPVIMLSGKDGFFDKVRGKMAGSTAYITKPFEPETLLKVVAEHCGASVVLN